MKQMKRSTVNLLKTILFGICTLTWLPGMAADSVRPLRVAMPIFWAAVSVLFLVLYFKSRRAEREGTV